MNWRRFVTILLWIAACLAVVATLYILVAPVQLHEITAVSGENPSPQQSSVRYVSWYQVQGVWGVTFVSLLGGLYLLTAVFSQRGRNWASLGTGVVTIVLTLLASLSVGPLYFPATLITLLAGAAGFAVRLRERDRSTADGQT
ncbi:MAG: hypothetical protein WBR18_13455 [Anaerolineales bacterium]